MKKYIKYGLAGFAFLLFLPYSLALLSLLAICFGVMWFLYM